MSLRTAKVSSIRGVSLYVFADCKVSIVAVNKIQMCAFATFVSLCEPQE